MINQTTYWETPTNRLAQVLRVLALALVFSVVGALDASACEACFVEIEPCPHEQDECSQDSDCGKDQACIADECGVLYCESCKLVECEEPELPSKCSVEETLCPASAKNECESDSDCGGWGYCISNLCGVGICSHVLVLCEQPEFECEADSDCGKGHFCQLGEGPCAGTTCEPCGGDEMEPVPPVTNEELCLMTGGKYDSNSCGHYNCGEQPTCEAVLPGCDCGPNMNFNAYFGCLEDMACQEEPECNTADDCGACMECNNGQCEYPTEFECTNDFYCPEGFECSYCGECVPVIPEPECITHQDCGDCGYCFDGQCDNTVPEGGGCDTDGWSCGEGSICNECGICVPEIDPCDMILCEGGSMCVDGECIPVTTDEQALCLETGGLYFEEACGHFICGQPNQCDAITPGCDCGDFASFVPGLGCVEQDICLESPDCFSDADCGSSETCWNGGCFPSDELQDCDANPENCNPDKNDVTPIGITPIEGLDAEEDLDLHFPRISIGCSNAEGGRGVGFPLLLLSVALVLFGTGRLRHQ
jgi:hypothetical protein